MNDYPRECWYVAATIDEIGDKPNTPVVLYRLADGSVAALKDRCVPRP